MKLIYAVVNNDDSHVVAGELTKNGYSATKLASTGGFLMSGNTTFLVCVEEEKVDDVIEIIRSCSRRRKQFMPAANMGRSEPAAPPVEVNVGGATIFVTDIERFEKL